MVNKEEIENIIYSFNKYIANQTEDEIMQAYWDNIYKYIEQLESKQQKITEALENKIKIYKELYLSSSRDVKIHRHAQKNLAEDILSILKGE